MSQSMSNVNCHLKKYVFCSQQDVIVSDDEEEMATLAEPMTLEGAKQLAQSSGATTPLPPTLTPPIPLTPLHHPLHVTTPTPPHLVSPTPPLLLNHHSPLSHHISHRIHPVSSPPNRSILLPLSSPPALSPLSHIPHSHYSSPSHSLSSPSQFNSPNSIPHPSLWVSSSTMIPEPHSDEEETDLPSTVDIQAIRDSPSPHVEPGKLMTINENWDCLVQDSTQHLNHDSESNEENVSDSDSELSSQLSSQSSSKSDVSNSSSVKAKSRSNSVVSSTASKSDSQDSDSDSSDTNSSSLSDSSVEESLPKPLSRRKPQLTAAVSLQSNVLKPNYDSVIAKGKLLTVSNSPSEDTIHRDPNIKNSQVSHIKINETKNLGLDSIKNYGKEVNLRPNSNRFSSIFGNDLEQSKDTSLNCGSEKSNSVIPVTQKPPKKACDIIRHTEKQNFLKIDKRKSDLNSVDSRPLPVENRFNSQFNNLKINTECKTGKKLDCFAAQIKSNIEQINRKSVITSSHIADKPKPIVKKHDLSDSDNSKGSLHHISLIELEKRRTKKEKELDKEFDRLLKSSSSPGRSTNSTTCHEDCRSIVSKQNQNNFSENSSLKSANNKACNKTLKNEVSKTLKNEVNKTLKSEANKDLKSEVNKDLKSETLKSVCKDKISDASSNSISSKGIKNIQKPYLESVYSSTSDSDDKISYIKSRHRSPQKSPRFKSEIKSKSEINENSCDNQNLSDINSNLNKLNDEFSSIQPTIADTVKVRGRRKSFEKDSSMSESEKSIKEKRFSMRKRVERRINSVESSSSETTCDELNEKIDVDTEQTQTFALSDSTINQGRLSMKIAAMKMSKFGETGLREVTTGAIPTRGDSHPLTGFKDSTLPQSSFRKPPQKGYEGMEKGPSTKVKTAAERKTYIDSLPSGNAPSSSHITRERKRRGLVYKPDSGRTNSHYKSGMCGQMNSSGSLEVPSSRHNTEVEEISRIAQSLSAISQEQLDLNEHEAQGLQVLDQEDLAAILPDVNNVQQDDSLDPLPHTTYRNASENISNYHSSKSENHKNLPTLNSLNSNELDRSNKSVHESKCDSSKYKESTLSRVREHPRNREEAGNSSPQMPELESYASIDCNISNVSPDSGIQSNNGSPLHPVCSPNQNSPFYSSNLVTPTSVSTVNSGHEIGGDDIKSTMPYSPNFSAQDSPPPPTLLPAITPPHMASSPHYTYDENAASPPMPSLKCQLDLSPPHPFIVESDVEESPQLQLEKGEKPEVLPQDFKPKKQRGRPKGSKNRKYFYDDENYSYHKKKSFIKEPSNKINKLDKTNVPDYSNIKLDWREANSIDDKSNTHNTSITAKHKEPLNIYKPNKKRPGRPRKIKVSVRPDSNDDTVVENLNKELPDIKESNSIGSLHEEATHGVMKKGKVGRPKKYKPDLVHKKCFSERLMHKIINEKVKSSEKSDKLSVHTKDHPKSKEIKETSTSKTSKVSDNNTLADEESVEDRLGTDKCSVVSECVSSCPESDSIEGQSIEGQTYSDMDVSISSSKSSRRKKNDVETEFLEDKRKKRGRKKELPAIFKKVYSKKSKGERSEVKIPSIVTQVNYKHKKKKKHKKAYKQKKKKIVDPVFLAEVEDLTEELEKCFISKLVSLPVQKLDEIFVPSVFKIRPVLVTGSNKRRTEKSKVSDKESGTECENKQTKRKKKPQEMPKQGKERQESNEQRLPLKKRHRHISSAVPDHGHGSQKSVASSSKLETISRSLEPENLPQQIKLPDLKISPNKPDQNFQRESIIRRVTIDKSEVERVSEKATWDDDLNAVEFDMSNDFKESSPEIIIAKITALNEFSPCHSPVKENRVLEEDRLGKENAEHKKEGNLRLHKKDDSRLQKGDLRLYKRDDSRLQENNLQLQKEDDLRNEEDLRNEDDRGLKSGKELDISKKEDNIKYFKNTSSHSVTALATPKKRHKLKNFLSVPDVGVNGDKFESNNKEKSVETEISLAGFKNIEEFCDQTSNLEDKSSEIVELENKRSEGDLDALEFGAAVKAKGVDETSVTNDLNTSKENSDLPRKKSSRKKSIPSKFVKEDYLPKSPSKLKNEESFEKLPKPIQKMPKTDKLLKRKSAKKLKKKSFLILDSGDEIDLPKPVKKKSKRRKANKTGFPTVRRKKKKIVFNTDENKNTKNNLISDGIESKEDKNSEFNENITNVVTEISRGQDEKNNFESDKMKISSEVTFKNRENRKTENDPSRKTERDSKSKKKIVREKEEFKNVPDLTKDVEMPHNLLEDVKINSAEAQNELRKSHDTAQTQNESEKVKKDSLKARNKTKKVSEIEKVKNNSKNVSKDLVKVEKDLGKASKDSVRVTKDSITAEKEEKIKERKEKMQKVSRNRKIKSEKCQSETVQKVLKDDQTKPNKSEHLLEKLDKSRQFSDKSVKSQEVLDKSSKYSEKFDKSQKLSEKSGKSQKLSEKSDKSQKLLENSDKSQKLSEKSDKSQKLSEKSDKSQKLSEKSDKSQKLSENSDKSQKLSDNSDKSQKLSENSDKSQKLSEKSDKSQKLSDNSDKSQKLSENSDKSQKLSEKSDKLQKLSDISLKSQKLSENSDSSQKLSENSDSSQKLSENSDNSQQLSEKSFVDSEKCDEITEIERVREILNKMVSMKAGGMKRPRRKRDLSEESRRTSERNKMRKISEDELVDSDSTTPSSCDYYPASSGAASSDESIKGYVVGEAPKKIPRWRRKFVVAGLFSDFYKQDDPQPKRYLENSLKTTYNPEEHDYSLLPPPCYCRKWLRERHTEFKLPYDLWWLHTNRLLPGRDIIPSWNYKKVKSNVYYDIKQNNQFEVPVCNCKRPTKLNEKGCGEDCINRMMYIECASSTCPVADVCSNQRIQRHEVQTKYQRFMTEQKGWGIKSSIGLKSGTFILEYVGEVVSEKEFKHRMQTRYVSDTHHYCLHLDRGMVIDGHRMGGDCRFVNHSCDPNCEMQKWYVNGQYRMALFALKDVKDGEELTYDYNFSLFNPAEGQPCKCGFDKCRGVIGGRSQRLNSLPPESKKRTSGRNKKESRKRRREASTDTETNQKYFCTLKPLSHQQKIYILSHRIFLLRNLDKVRRGREKWAKYNENKNSEISPLDVTENKIERFLTHFTALNTARSVKTRRLAQAEDDPEMTRIAKLAQIFKDIFDKLVASRDEKEKPLATPFMSLPSKKKTPTYYTRVGQPIDLNTIEKNILTGHYTTVELFDDDVMKLFANNLRFHGRNTDVGQMAVGLRKIYSECKLQFRPFLEEVLGIDKLHPAYADCTPNEEFEDEEVIRCVCNLYREEGMMIQCERCLVWQHCDCMGVPEGESPEHYLCEECQPRAVSPEVPMTPQPEDIPNEHKYFITLLRDNLQIKQGDSVYIMRDRPVQKNSERRVPAYKLCKDIKLHDLLIFKVENLWIDENGEKFAFGHHYLRPHETFHEPWRKFFPNEVIRSPHCEILPLDMIVKHCWVMDLTTYCRGKPITAVEEHIYICEYRVDKVARVFYKISKPKYPICTKPYAFITYLEKLKPQRTYTPHEVIQGSKNKSRNSARSSRTASPCVNLDEYSTPSPASACSENLEKNPRSRVSRKVKKKDSKAKKDENVNSESTDKEKNMVQNGNELKNEKELESESSESEKVKMNEDVEMTQIEIEKKDEADIDEKGKGEKERCSEKLNEKATKIDNGNAKKEMINENTKFKKENDNSISADECLLNLQPKSLCLKPVQNSVSSTTLTDSVSSSTLTDSSANSDSNSQNIDLGKNSGNSDSSKFNESLKNSIKSHASIKNSDSSLDSVSNPNSSEPLQNSVPFLPAKTFFLELTQTIEPPQNPGYDVVDCGVPAQKPEPISQNSKPGTELGTEPEISDRNMRLRKPKKTLKPLRSSERRKNSLEKTHAKNIQKKRIVKSQRSRVVQEPLTKEQALSLREKRRLRANAVSFRLLKNLSTEGAPVDLSYLFESTKRSRKKSNAFTS